MNYRYRSPARALRRETDYARRATAANDEAQALAAYKLQRLAAIASGVPEHALPPPQQGMDLRAANVALSRATGGPGNEAAYVKAGARPSALNRTVQGVANPPPEGNQADYRPQTKTVVQAQNPKSVIGPRPTGKETGAQREAMMDTSAARDAAFYAPHDVRVTTPGRSALDRAAAGGGRINNDPGVQDLLDHANGQPTAAEATAAARISGKTVQSAYGPIAVAGPSQQGPTPGGLTADRTWQQQLAAQYPELADATNPANQEFVAAYKAAQAANPGAPVDHTALAAQIVGKHRNQPFADEAVANRAFDPGARIPETAQALPGAARMNVGGASLPQPTAPTGTSTGKFSLSAPKAPAGELTFGKGGDIAPGGPRLTAADATGGTLANTTIPPSALPPAPAPALAPAKNPYRPDQSMGLGGSMPGLPTLDKITAPPSTAPNGGLMPAPPPQPPVVQPTAGTAGTESPEKLKKRTARSL